MATSFQYTEELWRTIFEETSDSIFIIDAEGRFLEVNPQACALLGYSREELAQLSWQELLSAENKAEVLAWEENEDQPAWIESQVRTKEGGLFPVEIRLHRLAEKHRLAFVRDIGLYKRAAEIQIGYELLVGRSRDIILVIRRDDGRILEANASAVKSYGYSREELLALSIHDLRAPETQPQTTAHINEAYTQGFLFETVHRRKDSSTFPVEVSSQGAVIKNTPVLINAIRNITERKYAEEALRKSEERFRLFMDNSPTTAWMQDDQSRYVYLNQTYENRFGVRLEEWRGKSMFEVWPAEVAAKYWQNDLQVLAAGRLLNFTQKIPNPDGSYSTWWIFKFPFQDETGQRYMAGVGLDITERQQMEAALQQSEERFAKAFRASPYALIISSLADGRIIEINDRWQEVFGYSREEVTGQSSVALDIFINPDARQNLVAQIQKESSVRDVETEIRRKTGEVRQVSLSSEMIELNNELCLLTTVRDITERRQIETALYLTRFSVERAADAIYWFDEESRIVDVNETACRMLGYSREEMLQHSISDLDPDITMEAWHAGWQCLKRQQEKTIERTHRTRDGRLIPVEIAGNLVEFRGQTLNCTFVRDISERKQAEETRIKLEERLRQAQKMESIGLLAGGVAHDFNNLLTVILGYSELIQAKLSPHEPLFEKVEQIRQSGKRAEALTSQLLAFSRKQLLVPIVLDLNELVTNLQKLLTRLISEDILLSTVLQPGLWTVIADPNQMEQVIMNLIVNARDAMPRGGRLTLETHNIPSEQSQANPQLELPLGPYVMLRMTDTGHGMDKATLSHIFEPFFTTKEQGKGTGLGLATVYGIIKQSGGEISVSSQPGQGTTFEIYLPAHETNPFNLNLLQPEPAAGQGHETILVVEDESKVRDLIRAALQIYGYTLLEAAHGYQALALAQQQAEPIDLLLTDVVMPQMDGRELAERLKALHPRIKVLFISGYTDNEFIRHGMQTADVEFLPKPFSPIALVAKIRAILDR